MNPIPNLIGYLYEDAERILKEAGVEYSFTETSSPRHDIDGEEKRVVRQVVNNEVINITLCRY